MYSAERRRDILRLVQETNSVSVDELAARFGVSASSVRRDLNELHRLGLVQRTYGGAMDAIGGSVETPFSVRVVSHHDEKERIGRVAARLVQSGDTIFVDGGTTTECMLSYLPTDAKITVVTFALNIVQRLVDQENVTVVVIGGTLIPATLIFGGMLATDSFDCFNIRFDKAFLAAGGIAADAGITNAGFEEIPMKRRAIRNARETILLADSSKLGVIAAGVVAPAEQLHRVVTGSEASLTEVEKLRRAGVIVDVA